MCIERNRYRKLCRQKRAEYNRLESIKLVELSKRDPKQFWREIKPQREHTGLPDCDFYSHFKQLAEREATVNEKGREEI